MTIPLWLTCLKSILCFLKYFSFTNACFIKSENRQILLFVACFLNDFTFSFYLLLHSINFCFSSINVTASLHDYLLGNTKWKLNFKLNFAMNFSAEILCWRCRKSSGGEVNPETYPRTRPIHWNEVKSAVHSGFCFFNRRKERDNYLEFYLKSLYDFP